MTLDAVWLEEILRPRLPREGTHGRLALVQWSGKAGYPAACSGTSPLGLWACFELTPTSAKSVTTNICVLILPKHLDQPVARAQEYVEGWLGAVDHFFSNAAPLVVQNVTPAKLVHAKVLDLARAQTADDFRNAILAPRRLGKLLGDVRAAMRSVDAGHS
jgi:hypothetical protein